MCRGGLAHNAVRAAAGERNGKRSGKGETEGSGPGPPSIVWVLGYDQRLRTESDVFVQPIFFRLIDVVPAHGLDLEEARAIVVLPTAMICHASSSVPPTGPDSKPPWRKNTVTGQAPRTITCDASWRHKRHLRLAAQRRHRTTSKPGRYCPHASTDYPRGSNWAKR
jgi:hypothetical protein